MTMITRWMRGLLVAALICLGSAAVSGEPPPESNPDTCIEDFEGVAGWEKQNGAQIEPADSAAVGKAALKFSMPGIAFHKVKMMDDYADCTRAVAKERDLATCDLHRLFKAFGREGINGYMADTAHPNARGHEAIANAIVEVLTVSSKP